MLFYNEPAEGSRPELEDAGESPRKWEHRIPQYEETAPIEPENLPLWSRARIAPHPSAPIVGWTASAGVSLSPRSRIAKRPALAELRYCGPRRRRGAMKSSSGARGGSLASLGRKPYDTVATRLRAGARRQRRSPSSWTGTEFAGLGATLTDMDRIDILSRICPVSRRASAFSSALRMQRAFMSGPRWSTKRRGEAGRILAPPLFPYTP